ncbi:MAG: hypothetical protein COY02_02800 [Parcubacteria group bacterium CG_4_10_14_0_2_um_filter_41_6]|nr:MAG: hypothetical protein COY02_02800 [Parcubacteria group bacterium CG_4_10_14_0_2_um_filter_41_6]
MTRPTSTESVYVIDTNILIGFDIWHPFKNCPDFWVKLESAIKDGKVILLDVVVDEVRPYNLGLTKWLKKQKDNGLIIKISDEVREEAVRINNQYKMINQNTGNSIADTYVIAFALLNGVGIFTRESPRKYSNQLYKIPDVCDKFGIAYKRSPAEIMSFIGINSINYT